jgi:hypothetical protein
MFYSSAIHLSNQRNSNLKSNRNPKSPRYAKSQAPSGSSTPNYLSTAESASSSPAPHHIGLSHSKTFSDIESMRLEKENPKNNNKSHPKNSLVFIATFTPLTPEDSAWIPDSERAECQQCKNEFGFFNRKHHCRHCGGIFDSSCTSNFLWIRNFITTELEEVRVCDECYHIQRDLFLNKRGTKTETIENQSKDSENTQKFEPFSALTATKPLSIAQRVCRTNQMNLCAAFSAPQSTNLTPESSQFDINTMKETRECASLPQQQLIHRTPLNYSSIIVPPTADNVSPQQNLSAEKPLDHVIPSKFSHSGLTLQTDKCWVNHPAEIDLDEETNKGHRIATEAVIATARTAAEPLHKQWLKRLLSRLVAYILHLFTIFLAVSRSLKQERDSPTHQTAPIQPSSPFSAATALSTRISFSPLSSASPIITPNIIGEFNSSPDSSDSSNSPTLSIRDDPLLSLGISSTHQPSIALKSPRIRSPKAKSPRLKGSNQIKKAPRAFSAEEVEWMVQADGACEKLFELAQFPTKHQWALRKNSEGISVSSMPFVDSTGKKWTYWRSECDFHCSPLEMLSLLHVNEERLCWDKSLVDFRCIHSIWPNKYDITYAVAAPSAGGTVSSRDFIDLRTWQFRNSLIPGFPVDNEGGDVLITGGISVKNYNLSIPNHPTKPIRGENSAGGHVIYPISNDAKSCRVVWLLCSNLNGWLPRSLIDAALSTVMFNFNANMRQLIDNPELKKQAARPLEEIMRIQ